MDDNRQFERANVSFSVMYKVNSPLITRFFFGGSGFDALALDVSEGGIGILVSFKIPARTLVTVKFTTVRSQDQLRSMEIKGDVRYCSYVKDEKAYRLGIRFLDISNDERDFIASFVKVAQP